MLVLQKIMMDEADDRTTTKGHHGSLKVYQGFLAVIDPRQGRSHKVFCFRHNLISDISCYHRVSDLHAPNYLLHPSVRLLVVLCKPVVSEYKLENEKN